MADAKAVVDASDFCGDCAFAGICRHEGYSKADLAALQCVVEHIPPISKGGYVVRRGEVFSAIYAVRSGSVKTSVFTRDGREQVLGFYLPGEVVGLNGIHPGSYPCDAIALEQSSFCQFAFPAISSIASTLPAVQQHLFRMLSRELGTSSRLAGDYSAEERVAAFLIDIGERFARRGGSLSSFKLTMSRADMASYLRLAPETVSRVITRFRDKRWAALHGRHVQLHDLIALREISQTHGSASAIA